MQTTNQAAIEIQARFYHGLADPSRLAILQTLRVGESTVSAVAASAGISISNASRHLACLRDCGLVEARHQWRHVNYRLSDGVAELLAVNDAFIERVTEHIAACHRPEMGD
ncbi:MAG: metalloregulator ArsR/SmtB family transcription factor [Chloroflexi bacterium]|nr:metalloregulator ArsR/SmtB family transcription factor [Chloroflexota bacterium]